MRLRVSYGERVVVRIEDGEIEAFRRSALYKLRMPALRRLVDAVDGDTIRLHRGLSHGELERLLACLEEYAPTNYELVCEDTFASLLEDVDAHLEERVRVGLAIKRRDESVRASFDTFRTVVDNAMVRRLRDQQLWDAFFLCAMGSAMDFSVPGSGKTASALATFAYLKHQGLVRRIVVVCPMSAFASWVDEWAACFGEARPPRVLDFHAPSLAKATVAERRRELRYNSGSYDLVLVNYEALPSLAAEVRDVASSLTMLVFDEVHKVKKIGGVWAASALEASRDAAHVVALTGTPIPNSYADVYNLLHILYPTDYDSFFGFKPVVLERPTPEVTREVNRRLQPFFCRTNKDALGVPGASEDLVWRVDATPPEQEAFDGLRDLFGRDFLTLLVRILQAESDPAMLDSDPEEDDLAGIFDEGEAARHVARRPTLLAPHVSCGLTAKTRACIDLVERLVGEGKPVLLWCFFRQSIVNLCAGLVGRGVSAEMVSGEVELERRERAIASFREGRTKVLVTNPQTLGESVSLHNVCHDAVYFEYGYNLVHLLQSKDRIHRLGLPPDQYTQYHFMQTVFDFGGSPWSLDANIYARLREKERVMLEAIDAGTLEAATTDEHDLDVVFAGLFA